MLKTRFRCLLKHRVLHYCPTKASKIINACVILHNMCIENQVPLLEIDPEDEIDGIDFGMYDDLEDPIYEANLRVNNDKAEGRRLRQRIIRNFF